MELYQILILAGIVCGVLGIIMKFPNSEAPENKTDQKDDPLGLRKDKK